MLEEFRKAKAKRDAQLLELVVVLWIGGVLEVIEGKSCQENLRLLPPTPTVDRTRSLKLADLKRKHPLTSRGQLVDRNRNLLGLVIPMSQAERGLSTGTLGL